jgi:hypothetical protein
MRLFGMTADEYVRKMLFDFRKEDEEVKADHKFFDDSLKTG